ncbi:MAG TPA: ABC transporter permease [Steroidobacteraceae bacterium]|nr:ABC transporter permease [Steroidobacteraceae bacterium]
MSAGAGVGHRPWALYGYAVFFLAFLYGPVLLLPLFSINDSTQIAFPIRSFTLRWYRELAQDQQLVVAFGHSVSVALVVCLITTALGVASGWALTRHRLPGSRSIIGFMMLPLVVPGLILGVSLLMVMGQLGIELSLLTVAIGHMVLCLPFSLAVMMSCFEGFDRSLEEASRDLGEGMFATFLRVVLPNALPAVISSLLMTFTISFDEFVLSFFLSGSQVTLPVYMWAQLRFPVKLPSVLALATLILLSSCLLIGVAESLRRMGRENREGAVP